MATEHDIVDGEKYLRDLTKSFTGLEKPLKNYGKSPATLDELIAELHNVFETDRVNIEYVNHLLLSYQSNSAEWKKFAKFDRYKYTRNLVDAGNGKFNLMILCWGEGHGSAIHDHANSHCFMKILKGQLREIRYAWPNSNNNNNNNNNTNNNNNNNNITECNGSADIGQQNNGNVEHEANCNGVELQELSSALMDTNNVFYINDNIGLHRVENTSHSDGAVSLHLYCPPYNSCSIFNAKTGKQSKCTVDFYSKYGQRRCKDMTIRPEDN